MNQRFLVTVFCALAVLCFCEATAQTENDAEESSSTATGPTTVIETGDIIGQVIDPEGGSFVRGVKVILEWPGADARDDADVYPREEIATTDVDGKYRFSDIPAGFYSIRFVKDGYRPSVLRDFEVLANSANRADFPLPPLSQAGAESEVFQLEEFEVGAETLDDSRVMLDELRRDAAGSVDFLSSEDFSKYAATDLADVVSRLPGVNVVEGKFAVVRGLGDRYNSTLVNGLPVPSPDPLRQGLQLDLFPTSIIENVVTNKQFLPYMPSNSSGAAFELNTKAFPEEFTVWFGVGARFNSNAQDEFLRDPNASGFDQYLGYGKNTRPPSIGPAFNSSQIVSTMRPTFAANPGGAPVGTKLKVGFGDTFKILDRNIGVIASGSYDSSYQTEFGMQQDRYGTDRSPARYLPGFPTNAAGDMPTPAQLQFYLPGSLYDGEMAGSDVRYNVTTSEGNVLIGALAGFSADLDPEGTNKISFATLYSHSATDFVQRKSDGFLPSGFRNGSRTPPAGVPVIVTDFAQGDSTNYNIVGRGPLGNVGNQLVNRDTISYEERALKTFQLMGDHLIEELDDLQVFWATGYASTSSDTPGQTVFNYSEQIDNADGRTAGYWIPQQQNFGETALTQLWRSIDETVYSARVDLDYDWKFLNGLEGNARTGFYYEDADRSTDQIAVQYNINTLGLNGGATYASPTALQNAIYQQSLVAGSPGISPSAPQPSFADNTRKVRAVHGTLTLPITEDIKVTGGARLEKLNMTAQGDAVLGILTLQDVLDYVARPVTAANVDQYNAAFPGLNVSPPGLSNGQILNYTNATAPGVIDNTAVLPAVTVTYDITEDVTFRGGWSRTLARPSFREMSPYFSLDLDTGDMILGNPQLELSPVDSWDARVEWRFGEGDLLAASVFYKDIENPIERVLLGAPSGLEFLSFINNEDRAIVKGFEVEARTSLSHWADELQDFSIGANWTMINANVAYPETIWASYFGFSGDKPTGPFVGGDGPPLGIAARPQERRLFDQPEWIVNADITYDNPDIGTVVTLSMFAQSDVLSSVGSGVNASVDQFTGSFYQLDLSFSQYITENLVIKFAIGNITDTTRTVFYQIPISEARIERLSYNKGRNYRFALEYTF